MTTGHDRPAAETPGAAATVSNIERQGEAVARGGEMKWFARCGLLARGVVYGMIGILALLVAVGAGGKTTSQQGALRTIGDAPLGKVLLLAVTAGLAAYALWRFVRAAFGRPNGESHRALRRVGDVSSGGAYAVLSFTAVEILVGAGSNTTASGPQKETAGVLGWPGGTAIVCLAGAVLLGVAAYQGYKGVSRRFLEEADADAMTDKVRRGFVALGVFGYLARMIVFGLVGYGLIKAALDYDPSNAVGLDGVLNELAHASYGPVLLGCVSAGLIGFAAYSVANARYVKS
jgi:Domain of Unknown Function (DUF1206)